MPTAKKPFYKRWWFIALAVLFVLYMIGNGADTPDSSDASTASAPAQDRTVTMEEYQAVQTGMSYADVVGIIGFEGEEMSRNQIEGVPGVMDATTTVMYQWVNRSGMNMNAMFQNDKLVQKAQFGLE